MAAFGLVPEGPAVVAGPPRRVFYLWPENLWMWELWLACRTQWHHGAESEKTGLNYPGCEVVMRRRRVPHARRDRAFELLQAMELEALDAWKQERAEWRAKQPR